LEADDDNNRCDEDVHSKDDGYDEDCKPSTVERIEVRRGGPEVLSEDASLSKRTLFLCYPDEDDEDDDHDDERPAVSLAARCLEHYRGTTVVHVGELMGDTLSMAQAPWGRSTSPEFHQRLLSEYHCILRATLTNWLHVRDTISVWKRSERCPFVFRGGEGQAEDENDDDNDNDTDEDEEVEYRHIPEEERLPVDVAAPCAVHLL